MFSRSRYSRIASIPNATLWRVPPTSHRSSLLDQSGRSLHQVATVDVERPGLSRHNDDPTRLHLDDVAVPRRGDQSATTWPQRDPVMPSRINAGRWANAVHVHLRAEPERAAIDAQRAR